MTAARDSGAGRAAPRRVRWTIADERGRVIAEGLTPRPMSDREALSWVLTGGPHDGTPPVLEPDHTYRVRAGDCATVAAGDEFRAVDEAATLDELALTPRGSRYLHEEPEPIDVPTIVSGILDSVIGRQAREIMDRAIRSQQEEAARAAEARIERLRALGIDPSWVESVNGTGTSGLYDVTLREDPHALILVAQLRSRGIWVERCERSGRFVLRRLWL